MRAARAELELGIPFSWPGSDDLERFAVHEAAVIRYLSEQSATRKREQATKAAHEKARQALSEATGRKL